MKSKVLSEENMILRQINHMDTYIHNLRDLLKSAFVVLIREIL